MRYGLGISGGGAGGEASAYGLCQATNHLPHLIDYIHFYCGSSAGAIIAACLAFGLPPQEVHWLLLKHNRTAFTKNGWLDRKLGDPVYDGSYLEGILHSVFGFKKMSDLKYDCYLVAYQVTDEQGDERHRRVKVFSRADTEVNIVDAVMASSAAPWFFGKWRVGDTWYGDGGVVDNLPTLLGMSFDHKLYGNPIDDYKCMSFITGGAKKQKRKAFNFGSIFSLAKHFPGELLPADIDGEILKIDNFIGECNHFVARPPLSDYGLDEVSAQPKLKKEWASYFEDHTVVRNLIKWIIVE